jgi:hypothetical protein
MRGLRRVRDTDSLSALTKLTSISFAESDAITIGQLVRQNKELKSLVLRDCHVEEVLPDLEFATNLETIQLLDVSGLKYITEAKWPPNLKAFLVYGKNDLVDAQRARERGLPLEYAKAH